MSNVKCTFLAIQARDFKDDAPVPLTFEKCECYKQCSQYEGKTILRKSTKDVICNWGNHGKKYSKQNLEVKVKILLHEQIKTN